ncbi:hypothetical protein [Mucilaginibacter pedocola]|uniref:Uncharacterized protein n=1 Tax=Mucilaginibacter pedocola TaxID=1792845 RepID=A0A1S9PHQ2_9SPHI|nr:hypothetical protein [Mucilaginibacter pedocola]OOQ60098.1 hypothetical protein BC343_26600 [Mucilaginibacter pedocola]
MIRKEAVIIGVVACVILTYLFTSDKTATEGYMGVGLPWNFYRYTSGRSGYVNHSQTGFNMSNFILDLTALAALIYGIHVFLERNVKKKTRSEKPTYLP